jgi:hypothetical protein
MPIFVKMGTTSTNDSLFAIIGSRCNIFQHCLVVHYSIRDNASAHEKLFGNLSNINTFKSVWKTENAKDVASTGNIESVFRP